MEREGENSRKKQRKYALVLSGGGFKGAFQLGALNHLYDNWKRITGLSSAMKFDIIAGVSVGAVNGSMLASNKLGLLNELWLNKIAKNGVSEIYASDFIDTAHNGDELKMKLDFNNLKRRLLPNFKLDLGVFQKIGMLFSKQRRKAIFGEMLKRAKEEIKIALPTLKSVADNNPLKIKLEKYLSREYIKDTKFICGFVSLDTGKYHAISHNSFLNNHEFVKGVLASAAIPMVFEPVDTISFNQSGKKLTVRNNIDGGVKNVSPLGDVVKLIQKDTESEYTIIVINCHSGENTKENFDRKHIGQIAARSSYEIAFNEIFTNDIRHFLRINNLVKQVRQENNEVKLYGENGNPLRNFDAVVIQPDPEVDLGNSLVANEKLIRKRVNHGEVMAEKVLGGKQ